MWKILLRRKNHFVLVIFDSILPWKAISRFFIVGLGMLRKRAYMDMTIPGVQKPHCDPWDFAIRSCTGWSRVRVLPMPSTVVTAIPWTAQTGVKHAFAATWLFFNYPWSRKITLFHLHYIFNKPIFSYFLEKLKM